MSVCIIDYGMGNLRSVCKGLEKAGCTVQLARTPAQVADATAIVLPGVGAFAQCYENLTAQGMVAPIRDAISAGKPFLGICLGLQILLNESEEFGSSPGLGIVPGAVKRFAFNDRRLKIPHMGWNRISIKQPAPLLEGIPDGSYVYFVHSYYTVPDDPAWTCTTTAYGTTFTSSIWRDNLFACQFHPEKSQAIGLRILQNFARLAG